METTLKDMMASGVFVDFRDADGNTLGSAVYWDWRGRPVPAVGDRMCCRLTAPTADGQRKLVGEVRTRCFDVQFDDAGEPCVWVQMVVEVPCCSLEADDSDHQEPAGPQPRPWFDFSAN